MKKLILLGLAIVLFTAYQRLCKVLLHTVKKKSFIHSKHIIMPYTLSFFLIIGVLSTSCNKNEQELSPHLNTFSANVNGATFVPTSIEVLFGGSSIPSAKQVNIEAKVANGHTVTLIMLNYDGTLKTFTNSIGAYTIAPGGLYNSSHSINGEVEIYNIDRSRYSDGAVVTGTFQFDTDSTVGTYSITDGNFSVFVKH